VSREPLVLVTSFLKYSCEVGCASGNAGYRVARGHRMIVVGDGAKGVGQGKGPWHEFNKYCTYIADRTNAAVAERRGAFSTQMIMHVRTYHDRNPWMSVRDE
jgi:hypothetical protein